MESTKGGLWTDPVVATSIGRDQNHFHDAMSSENITVHMDQSQMWVDVQMEAYPQLAGNERRKSWFNDDRKEAQVDQGDDVVRSTPPDPVHIKDCALVVPAVRLQDSGVSASLFGRRPAQ
jgi:hypothetical protein